jgi:hypothetical protein
MPIVPGRLATLMDGLAEAAMAMAGEMQGPSRGHARTRIDPWGIDVVVCRTGRGG